MSQFGELLREYRQSCNDPEIPGRRLSQERLGELLGEEINMRLGYSGAAISDWERGKSKIHADQRLVLVSLIKVFNRLGALKSIAEANQFLEAGNYRALDRTELIKVSFEGLPTVPVEISEHRPKDVQQLVLERIFSLSSDELETLLNEAKEGPTPFWPRVFVALLRRLSDRWSVSRTVRPLVWLWTTLLTWWLIMPSLRWPFVNQSEAIFAIEIYIAGTFVIPLFIGVLADTVQDSYWIKHDLANAITTRLYAYQGAGIGFHLGYFGVFALNIIRYYLGFPSSIWWELPAIGVMLFLGYTAARLVPYNLWRAYKRLSLADGWIFFIFIFVGPFFGFFFIQFYPFIVSSILGGIIVLSVLTLMILREALQHYRRTGSE